MRAALTVRTDLRYTAWQAPRMRRRIERLLPPAAGSPDPHRLLTDGCPLAGRLRAALAPWLARPDIAALLRACESDRVIEVIVVEPRVSSARVARRREQPGAQRRGELRQRRAVRRSIDSTATARSDLRH